MSRYCIDSKHCCTNPFGTVVALQYPHPDALQDYKTMPYRFVSPLVKWQLETGRQLSSASARDLRTPRTPSTLPPTGRPGTAGATRRSTAARRSSRTARPATVRRSRSRTEMLENRRLSRVEEAVAATRGGGETAVFGRGDPALVLVPPGTFNRGVSDRDAGLIMFQREDEKRKIEEFYRGGLWGPFGGPCLTGPKVG